MALNIGIKKPYLRGINETLAKQFKESSLGDLVKKDKDLLACIRNNAIGIYHLADKVAMIHRNRKGELVCDIMISMYQESTPGKNINIRPGNYARKSKI